MYLSTGNCFFILFSLVHLLPSEKIFFVELPGKSERICLIFLITTSFNICRVKLHYKNKIYETLMGKGFQRTTKKNKMK